MPENVSLRDKLRRVGAALLAQIHIYRLTGKPIVIFATRRSGSTLLVEVC